MFDDPINIGIAIFLGLVILVALLVLLRQFFCWYYKIDERLEESKRTNALMEKLLIHHGVNTEEKEKDQSN